MARIHLVRHGLSEANMDKSVNGRKPDHAVSLAGDPASLGGEPTLLDPTGDGFAQARFAGDALARIILDATSRPADRTPGVQTFVHRRVRLYVSPYLRTRQTADGLEEGLRAAGIQFDRKEYLALREISFGLYDGLSDDELAERFPLEHAHYAKHMEFEGGEFFAPMPMGESRIQVADRVRGTFGSILRDMSGDHRPPVTDAVVVAHGVTNRCFRLGWFNRPWEWYAAEKNPPNLAIDTIEGASGRGWTESRTFAGFEHVRNAQAIREEGVVKPRG